MKNICRVAIFQLTVNLRHVVLLNIRKRRSVLKKIYCKIIKRFNFRDDPIFFALVFTPI